MVIEIIETLKDIFSRVYTNMLVAIIILLVGLVFGRFVGKVVSRVLEEIELNKILRKAANIKISVEEILSNFIKYFIYFVTIIMALDQLGATTTVLQIISIAIIVIIVASVLLGLRDFLPNIMAGIFIHQKRFLRAGDKVKIGNVQGKIVSISLTETRIKTNKDDIIYIPNSILTKKEVVKLKK